MWLLSKLSFRKKETVSWQELTVLFLVLVLSVTVRYWYIEGGTLVFSFDQARDAYLARQIVTDHDLKIQGPNASGTNDTIYHGVLYYYLIAPFYAITSNPMQVAFFLILLTTLGLIPSYFLIKSATGSKTVAVFAIAAAAVSINTVQAATWLSNPTIALVTLPLVYYATWKVFIDKSSSYLPLLALALGSSIQSAIWFAYLLLTIPIFALRSKAELSTFASRRQWFTSVIVFILSIATMLLTQLKLAHAGIFTVNSFFSSLGHGSDTAFSISGSLTVIMLFIEKMSKSFFPLFPLASVFILLWSLWYLVKTNTIRRTILLVWLFGPFAILAFQAREAQHLFITTEIALYGIFALALEENLKKHLKSKIVYLFIGLVWFIIACSQIQFAAVQKISRVNDYTLQSGMFLKEELAAIDWTYERAQGKPFTIATYTAPYGYNTLWAYLYDWYGRNKYGYTPSFYGGDQTGVFAGELLPRVTKTEFTHFIFLEPFVGAPKQIQEQFELEQSNMSTFSGQQYFGTLHVIHRSAKSK